MAGEYNAALPSTSTVDFSGFVVNDRRGGLGIAKEDDLSDADVQWRVIAPPLRLGQWTVMCLIFNRMIGTGIFRTPATVFNYTQSVGISMLWWSLGVIVAMSGILVYMELGLTLPLYWFDNPRRQVSVPRSGGELNYLKYIYMRPGYFVTCVFGIAFILLGNVATNSIAFATSLLDAAGKSGINNHDEIVRGIAIGLVAFSCIIHGSWRQGGIYLNNILAIIKIAILTMIFIIGVLTFANVFPREPAALDNFNGVATFEGSKKIADAYGYAESFLAILFTFGGLNQANYVMGEIDDPRRRYKWPAFSAVAIVSLLYILVNVAYFIVVPAGDFATLTSSNNVAHKFFELTFGKLNTPWAPKAPQMLSAFMALSSLGNVVVMTYTAARVKQEIAKEGILPLRRFLARSTKALQFPIQKLWGSRVEPLPEDIPIGALCLHFLMSIILILGTWPMTASDSYSLLVDLYSYVIDATFGACLGFGLLWMRLFSNRDWKGLSKNSGFRASPFVSITVATIFGIANLYPVAAKWVPPTIGTILHIPWFTIGVVGWSILACGTAWWFAFIFIVPNFGRTHRGCYLLVTRKLWFHDENEYKVLEYEDIDFTWPTLQDGEGSTLVDHTYNAEPQEVSARMMRDNMYGQDGQYRAISRNTEY